MHPERRVGAQQPETWWRGHQWEGTGCKPQTLAPASRRGGEDLQNQILERLEPEPSGDLDSGNFGELVSSALVKIKKHQPLLPRV